MAKEKMGIVMHKFIGSSPKTGSHTYEITFNRSLENTHRMDAMCKGLDDYDRRMNHQTLWQKIRSRFDK